MRRMQCVLCVRKSNLLLHFFFGKFSVKNTHAPEQNHEIMYVVRKDEKPAKEINRTHENKKKDSEKRRTKSEKREQTTRERQQHQQINQKKRRS